MKEIKTKVLVVGSGPAGYSAAFRCADLGLEVVLVERFSTLGGVCLNVGCIPSKALLHVAKVIEEAEHIDRAGVYFEKPKIDISAIDNYKTSVVGRLTDGLAAMAKMRKVTVVQGYAKFTNEHCAEVKDVSSETVTQVIFEKAIIAAGSRPIELPFIPHDDPRVWNSTDALDLKEIPQKLLVMGGGIIGLEMGTVYQKLGAVVDVVEMFDQLIPAADKDVMKIYTKENSKRFNIMLKTKVVKVEAKDDGIHIGFESVDGTQSSYRCRQSDANQCRAYFCCR
jgi:dihydrolipoamide dehydrogenase